MSITPHPTKNRHLPEGWTGKRWWYIVTYPNGRAGGKENLLFEGTKAEAQRLDLETRRMARKAPISVNPPLSSCVPDFIEWYRLDRAELTVEGAIRHLNKICQHMGQLPLTAITTQVIDKYKRARLADGMKPASINNELFHLNVLLTWAQKENLVGEVVKCEKFPSKLTRSAFPSMPTRAEFEAIVAAVRPEVRGIAMLEFYAGLRRSEALNITAECVFLDRGLIIVLGKGNKQRIVPVQHPGLLEELKRKVEEVKTGYLWVNPVTGKPYKNLRDSLRAAAREAGVSMRVYPHLLRHGFGTGAAELGMSITAQQAIMGHAQVQTTMIYTHMAATHLIEEMRKMHHISTVSNKSEDKT